MGLTARWAVVALTFVLSAVALGWAAWQWYSPPAARPPTSSTPSTSADAPPPSLLQSPSPPPSPSSPSKAPAHSATAAPVATASTNAPTEAPTTSAPPPHPTKVVDFAIPTAGYSSAVGTMEIADSGVINPPDFERTWWIRDRGVPPSSQATDTTYLACHTHSRKSALVVPCNRVTLDNVPVGSKLSVSTDAETLSYTVIQARKVPREEFEHDPDIWDVNPGRLVWISCYLEDGRYSAFNIVVIAELDA